MLMITEQMVLNASAPGAVCSLFHLSVVPLFKVGSVSVPFTTKLEQVHEISNNVVCATSKASDQPAHTHSLIRAFACRLNIL